MKQHTYELYDFGAATIKPVNIFSPVSVQLPVPLFIGDHEREEYAPTAVT